MDTGSIIAIVVAVIVVIIGSGVLARSSAMKRREVKHHQAEEIRAQAAAQATEIRAQEARAAELEAEARMQRAAADQMSAQAERVEAEAAEQLEAAARLRAEQDQHLRRADEIDPAVRNRGAQPRDDHESSAESSAEHVRSDGVAAGEHDSSAQRHDSGAGPGTHARRADDLDPDARRERHATGEDPRA